MAERSRVWTGSALPVRTFPPFSRLPLVGCRPYPASMMPPLHRLGQLPRISLPGTSVNRNGSDHFAWEHTHRLVHQEEQVLKVGVLQPPAPITHADPHLRLCTIGTEIHPR